MAELVGQSLGHYRIVEKIGAGGMGEVYRAHDEWLDRDVAVKVLPEAVAEDLDRLGRFQREARAAAALNHPCILAVYELGEHEGRPFLVSELLDGASLRDRMREGPLPQEEAVAHALQIAAGLAAAHDRGIVHRDLKPENIFVTRESGVKILDFGLAKLKAPCQDLDTETPAATLQTSPGTVIGTVGYMSPEQLRGEPADARSDVFALGVVLYEMLAGARPFAGETTFEVTAAILKDHPSPPSRLASAVGPELDSIVSRCLDKRPERRYQTAREFGLVLRSSRSTSQVHVAESDSTSTRSIAVLPFDIVGDDEEVAYLGDGLTEGITGRLCGLEGIDRVVARHSVSRYKDVEVDPAIAGEELGVDSVLVGDVALRGDRLVISTELIAVPRGDRLWGSRYSRPLADLVDIEDAISKAVVDSLRLELSEADHARVGKRHTDVPEAYRLYLKGRHLWNKRSHQALERSIELYRQAIELDPRFALAHSGIADSWVSLAWNDFVPRRIAFKEALSSALTALDIDHEIAESHVSLGMVLAYLGTDWARAELELRRASEIRSSCAEAYHQYAHLLAFMGRTAQAVEVMQRAVELEPVSRIINCCHGQILYFARSYDEAAAYLEAAIELEPEAAGPFSWLGMVQVQRQDWAGAQNSFERGIEAGSFVTRNTGALGYCYGLQGHSQQALGQLQQLATLAAETPVDPCFEAWIHVGVGDVDAAVASLERAYDRDANWLLALKVDPFFDGLRSSPGFQDVLRRMDFPDE